ncbi:NADPH-dependent 1-acyl dihydroxyacetone phosphate reductase [Teratosphaeriaceae sp. CCFEE 6253]|nr:NADPH-dependent 1-acyl dihydroxyacetone phosphate reductase [Teratosphaeriaceae sp. CCFEE 6253]
MAKTVLITGCSSGIGHALALEFHAQGHRVFATARKTPSIADLEARGIETLALEVTDAASIAALRDALTARTGGRLDVLVNNAGRNYTVPALDVDLAEVRAVFETNVYAVMALCQAFAPLVIASKGTIVQIGSLAAVMPYVFGGVYNASKGALHSYTDTLRVELAPFGVRVVNVITGGVASNLTRVERDLPTDSIYLPVLEQYNRRQKHSKEVGVPCEEYARVVVGKLLKTKKVTLWEGYGAWLVWFASSYLPRSVLELYMARTFQLWRLKDSNTKKLK